MVTKGTKKRKSYTDYLTATISGAITKWVTDSLVRDRRIVLYGIDVAIVQVGHKVEASPVIPCAGPLMDVINANPEHSMFSFNRKSKKWKVNRGD